MAAVPPEVSFSGHMADAELAIAAAGFSTDLWTPEFGWEAAEEEAAEAPHPPQLLAALQCFLAFFTRRPETQRFWVHLAAEMQAGKTGVVTALIRLILKNAAKLRIRPTRMFVLTGMNDNAWKKQTRDRLPIGIRQNVFHNGGLAKFARAITGLAAGGELKDVLIVLDESHLASSVSNRPQKFIYEAVNRLCPQEKWAENNIRILTISATDPAKVLTVRGAAAAEVIRLQTTEAYQSVLSLAAAGRVRWLETHHDIHTAEGIAELLRCVTEEFADQPRYHILRTRYGKGEEVLSRVRAAFPGCPAFGWDSEEKLPRSSAGGSGSSDSSSGLDLIEDINEILAEKPEQHTFIVLKNMLYAAKTLDDEHVGVLWDRLSAKDDTNLQSLLGRACGYGKSSRTVVYASKATVENYRNFWRELCANPDFPSVLQGVPVSHVKGKMTGVTARRLAGGRGAEVFAAARAAAPGGSAGGATAPTRRTANEDDFEHTVTEFKTLAEAKFKHMRTPKMDEETKKFYLTSTTGSPEKLSYTAVLTMCGGKKTSNMPWGGLEVGAEAKRLYVGYKDLNDPASAVFVVRTLRRIK
jgi:hypothetical protein